MRFWFNRKARPATDLGAAAPPAEAAASSTPRPGDASTGSEAAAAAPPPPAPPAAPRAASTAGPPASMLASMSKRLLAQSGAAAPPTGALNDQIVQAVQMSNAENVAYAPSQIALGPNMMISQASGLIAQSSAAYFDGVSKLALASQGVLLKQMTENLVKDNLAGAAEDALGVLATDVLLGAAAAVAAAAGALEAESASFAIDRIDQSIAKYSDVLRSSKAAAA